MREYYKFLKNLYKDSAVVIKYGKFYRTFDDDAFVLSEITKYKLHNLSVGFPDDVLNKVINSLNASDIKVIVVIKKECIFYNNIVSNNYYKILDMSKLFYDLEEKINNISLLVKNILMSDINNYKIIMEYLNEF